MSKERKWGHNELANDLADHLAGINDRVIWTDMQMGPQGSPRPDVYTIPKSYTRFTPIAYEVKVSVADFRRDVTAGKWQSYLSYAAGVFFAVPHGLVTKADVPAGCGLIVRGPDGWRTAKAPTLQHIETLNRDAWMKLMIDGIRRQRDIRMREFQPWAAQAKLAAKFGETVAQLLHDVATAEDRLRRKLDNLNKSHEQALSFIKERYELAEEKAEQSRNQIDAERAMLAEVLGLDPCANAFHIAAAMQRVRDALDRDEVVKELRSTIQQVRRLVRDHGSVGPLAE